MTQTLQTIVLVAAAMGAVGLIVQRLYRGLKAVVHAGQTLSARVRAIDELVGHELRPNGGFSLKDQVSAAAGAASMAAEAAHRLASRVEDVDGRVGRIEGSHATLTTRVEGIAERITLLQLDQRVEAQEARNEAAGRHDRHDDDLGEVITEVRRIEDEL